jgi:hypothetical protein
LEIEDYLIWCVPAEAFAWPMVLITGVGFTFQLEKVNPALFVVAVD